MVVVFPFVISVMKRVNVIQHVFSDVKGILCYYYGCRELKKTDHHCSLDTGTIQRIQYRYGIGEYVRQNCQFLQKDLFGYVTEIHVKSLNTEKVGTISASYQPNADKPTLYPIEIPKYTDVTVKLK